MSAYIIQGGDGGFGIVGAGGGSGGFLRTGISYTATSVDSVAFTATRDFYVRDIVARPEVAGTDGGAVTATIKKAASGTAIASGTALHSGTINLKGTAATNQTMTLSTTASDLYIPAGTSVGVDYTGVLTSAVGSITIMLVPA